MAPLKIGILGAARIADDGIVDPSRVLGHRLVAVAARDQSRAEAIAAQRGVEKVHQTYAEVIDDPEVEVVYNALVNSLHAKWNQYALNAGKHVLSEKPFAANAAEALVVRDVARTAPGQIVEGFHYLHHPVNQRLRELVTSGELVEVQQIDIELSIPALQIAIHDGRWSWPAERRWISGATCSMPPVSSVAGLIKHHQWSEPKPPSRSPASMLPCGSSWPTQAVSLAGCTGT
jgi:predicted dehydrogenase